jgi:malonyl-CoA/methylmalonyl-CoA synthetase
MRELIDKLQETIARRGDAPFLIDARSGRTLTYEEVAALASGIAGELRERGLGRGSRLALDLPNSLELAAIYLGALTAGVVVVPLGSGFGRGELRSILSRSRPDAVFTAGAATDRLQPLVEELGLTATRVAVDDADGAFWPLAATPTAQPPLAFADLEDRDLAAVHFTSGTTGAPRGVAHGIGDFLGNARRFAAATGIDESSRLYATLPMTYMAGYYNLLLLPLAVGASVVLDRAFDARSLLSYWDAPIRHEVDVLWLVPTIMAMLLEADRGDRGATYCRDGVRLAISGTAPLDPGLRSRFEEAYGITVHDSYGLSETLLSVASSPARPAPIGSVGTALPGVEIEIRRAGAVLPPGAEGVVHLATPDVMAGYVSGVDGDRLELDSPLEDGRWFETGDVGLLGADGVLRITGRMKELIIRGGVNVSALTVERALELHPAVERAAVVGIPHELLGEEIAAVVVLREGTLLEETEADLRARARTQLEPGQQPGIYLQIDELPETATGKIRKAVLRDIAIDRLGLPTAGKGFRLELEPAHQPPPATGLTIVDLSHPIREGMLSFPSPNHVAPTITQIARHEVEGRETRRVLFGTHTGTHVDAPLHFIPGGGGIETLDLAALVGPAVVADLTPAAPLEPIGVERLQAAIGPTLRHPRLLLRFDWSQRFVDLDFYASSPHLEAATCEWLLEQGIRLLGMDTPSPDDPRLGYGSGNDSPNHKLLLGRGVVLLEYLANLDALGAETFLAALPLPLSGSDGAPARVVAIEFPGGPGRTG